MKLNYPTYEQYKDSGVQWLGEIPQHWVVAPGFVAFTERKEKNIKMKEDVVLTLSYGKIKVKPLEKLTGLVPESFETYQIVHPDDIIIRPTDLQNDKTSLRVGISPTKGIITSAYINIIINHNNYPRYYYYLLYILDMTKMIYGLGSGLRQNIDFDSFKKMNIILPPLPEQTAIAAFLDKKTSQIEAAIARKERQIALLKEHRQILIHRAVTRGLNPNVPMKNSGIEWVGEIPSHWEVKRLASFGKFSKGGGFSKADLTAEGIPAILYGDIYTRYEISIGTINRFVSYPTAEQSIRIKKGNLLFTGSGETIEDIGKCVLFNSDLEVVAGGDVIIFQQSVNHGLYLSYTLNSEGAKFEKARHSKGEIIVHTYGSKLKNIFIPLPPLEDQTAIAAFLEKKSSQIETAISLKHAEIIALKELKTTLINAAVTGKIKV